MAMVILVNIDSGMACLSGFEYNPVERMHPYKFFVLLAIS